MRFQRIIQALYREPLDITPAGFEALDAIVRPHLVRTAPSAERQAFEMRDDFVVGKTDLFGTPLADMLDVDEETGCMIISINGPLLQHAALIDKSCGACSYQDIKLALDRAMDSRAAGPIILNIDSPGGQHCGVLEVADKVAGIALGGEKEIYSFTEGTEASAAFCLAAACNGKFATRSAFVGCIGSLMGFVDFSKAYEMAGLKAVILASGKYKGTAQDGTSLTDEQQEYLMGLVLASSGQFKEHVLEFRDVDSESMEGQCFYGEDAMAAGLVDDVVADLEEVIKAVGGESQ
jgi:ClpP class serine protease